MPEIIIAVQNKLPILAGAVQHIVADNSDYTIRFLFDDQWEEGEKTVYFVRSNGYAYAPVKTVDGVVQVPVQTDVNLMSQLLIGVRQGEVKTSRPCGIAVYPAISNVIKDDAVQPKDSLWEKVLDRLDELEKNGGVDSDEVKKIVDEALEEAKESGEFKGESGVYVGSAETMPEGTKVRVDPNGKKFNIPQIDDTLTREGFAADAKAVGQRFNDISVYVTPQMFGAVGDGVADDTAAIQAALDNGGHIYFPAGRYKTTDLLTVSKSCRIEMFKPYPQTYKAEYPLTAADNWMGARIDTYSPNGGMVIGDGTIVDGLYIKAFDGFAGVVLKFDDTIGAQTYPQATRLKHIKLEIDPNSYYKIFPESMFDFMPDDSYQHILEDIVIGRGGFCEYGFRTDLSKTPHKWAYNVAIRNLCVDIHADFPIYIAGDAALGASLWMFESVTVQAYDYTRTQINRPGHINLLTLKNVGMATFVNCYLWDVGQATVVGEIIKAEQVTNASVIGCGSHFDSIEEYLRVRMKRPENLNIEYLNLSVKDNVDGTANTLKLSDGTHEKEVDIPKVEMSDEQIGDAIGIWMDANAQPKETPGKNKFDYNAIGCIYGSYNTVDFRLVTKEMNPAIVDWVSDYIEVRAGDVLRVGKAGVNYNPYKLGVYSADYVLIDIKIGFTAEDSRNGITITNENAAYVRVEFNKTTYGEYENRADSQVCVTVNNGDVTYEDYYTELVGGIGSFMALQSPNGTKYTLTVSDDGVLSAVPAE